MNNDSILRAGSEVSRPSGTSLGFDGTIEKQKQPNKFLSILKGVGSAAASFIPGFGGIAAGFLNGGPDFGSLQAMVMKSQQHQMQMLGLQHQVSTQGQEFTAITNLLKARHDSEMSAVSNFKS